MKNILQMLTLTLVISAAAFSQQGRSQKTSERYDSDDVKTISGTITEVNHPHATLKGIDGKEYEIHMGPLWFWQRHEYVLEKGAKVEVKGETEDVKGTTHIYPWQIKQEYKVMMLTDEDGVPEWAGRRNSRGGGFGWNKSGFRHGGHGPRCCGCNW